MKEEKDLVYIKTQTALAHPPLYMWDQSGELGETDYKDCDDCGTQASAFLLSIRVSQYGMLLVLAVYITEVQRQSSSVHNVV